MRRVLVCLMLATSTVASAGAGAPSVAEAAGRPPNIVLLIADDQRWDTMTSTYMPNVLDRLADSPASPDFPDATSTVFTNAFVPNPLCCPSRTSILTGRYSHTTGVWRNAGPFGGFGVFRDRDTLAVDFDRAGYRTAMIGKYLNGYRAGEDPYKPPGWDRWFATRTGAYYHFRVTANHGRVFRVEDEPKNYITRVLSRKAIGFVNRATEHGDPFFLYYAFTAPHAPAVPDPRDVGRFGDGRLESIYGVDRAVGQLLDVLPVNTIVVYMSDNGVLRGEEKGTWGSVHGKAWPYDASIRIPMVITSLDGTYVPRAQADDIVLNVDLRATLTHAAGLSPSTSTEGLDWGGLDFVPRDVFPLEHYGTGVPSYCGAREKNMMFVHYVTGQEELYSNANVDESASANVVDDPLFGTDYVRLRAAAERLCSPVPPDFSWGP
jgi:arylsulfatase A-like enzyme